MNIVTVLKELNKGDVFTTQGKVVYNKKPQTFQGSKGAFHTQFILLQDDSTGYSANGQSLPIVVGVKEGESYSNEQVLTIKGTIDVWQGTKKYKGRVIGVEATKEEDIFGDIFGGYGVVEEHAKQEPDTPPEKKPAYPDKEESIARSVAIKAAAEMVAGKAFKIAEFWTWVYNLEDYVLYGKQEPEVPEVLIETDASLVDDSEVPF